MSGSQSAVWTSLRFQVTLNSCKTCPINELTSFPHMWRAGWAQQPPQTRFPGVPDPKLPQRNRYAPVDNSVEKDEVATLPETPAPAAWRAFLALVRGKVSDQTFNTWFRPLQFGGVDESRLLVDAPGDFSPSGSKNISSHFWKKRRSVRLVSP